MLNDIKTAIQLLKNGKSPGNYELINELSVGVNFISDFWKDRYLDEYILEGGSKIKFVTGNSGSGKTHFLELLSALADVSGYICTSISAKQVWVHDFKNIYIEALKQSDIISCLKKCSHIIIRELGYDESEIPNDLSFVDYLSGKGLMDPITKREIRLLLNKMFLHNPLVDNNFALACSLITGGILGHPTLEEPNKALLISWLMGEKEATLPAIRRLGLSPSKITKYNARHMLRSLVEIIKISGKSGVIITIDNLDILVNTGSLEEVRYTKQKREDAYESIRELIDEIDTLKNVMFVFAFDRKLIDDEAAGLKSYWALWMRIQNEVTGEKLNKFTDILDLDRLAMQEYNAGVIVEMSKRLAKVLEDVDFSVKPISDDQASKILSRIHYASIPRQINRVTINGPEVEAGDVAPINGPEVGNGDAAPIITPEAEAGDVAPINAPEAGNGDIVTISKPEAEAGDVAPINMPEAEADDVAPITGLGAGNGDVVTSMGLEGEGDDRF
ncbi:MAG: ATP-binding protein [Synergistaceae bacterium]|nr:ATP-binding protein [Synergistaceae bacterium]